MRDLLADVLVDLLADLLADLISLGSYPLQPLRYALQPC